MFPDVALRDGRHAFAAMIEDKPRCSAADRRSDG
jgi:hypothetical protein